MLRLDFWAKHSKAKHDNANQVWGKPCQIHSYSRNNLRIVFFIHKYIHNQGKSTVITYMYYCDSRAIRPSDLILLVR